MNPGKAAVLSKYTHPSFATHPSFGAFVTMSVAMRPNTAYMVDTKLRSSFLDLKLERVGPFGLGSCSSGDDGGSSPVERRLGVDEESLELLEMGKDSALGVDSCTSGDNGGSSPSGRRIGVDEVWLKLLELGSALGVDSCTFHDDGGSRESDGRLGSEGEELELDAVIVGADVLLCLEF